MEFGYFAIVLFLIFERLFELRLSSRNQKKLLSRGYEFVEPRWQLQLMVVMHILWFVSLICEPIFLHRTMLGPAFSNILIIFALSVLLAAQVLRVWTINTLGEEWNIAVMKPNLALQKKTALVCNGPYRYIKHPNYVAVILEFFTVPLIIGAFYTLIIFSLFNFLVLFFRIRTEDAALQERTECLGNLSPS